MDRDTTSKSSKESPNVEEGGKMGFLGEDKGIILKKNPILQTSGIPARGKVQRKLKKGRERAKKANTQGAPKDRAR